LIVLREGVAGRNGPLGRVPEDGCLMAGWRQGGNLLPPVTIEMYTSILV
jgi:hypothetical protein